MYSFNSELYIDISGFVFLGFVVVLSNKTAKCVFGSSNVNGLNPSPPDPLVSVPIIVAYPVCFANFTKESEEDPVFSFDII